MHVNVERRSRRRRWLSGVAVVLVLLVAGPAHAQIFPGDWQVAPHATYTRFDGTSAIENGPGVGISMVRFFTDQLAVGPDFNFSRTRSDGSFFPALEWQMGTDSSRITLVGQELSIMSLGLRAELHVPLSGDSIRAYGVAGGGAYSIFLDPQSNRRSERITKPGLLAGAGLDFTFGSDMGLRLELRDLIMTGYDRERLRLVDERFESKYFVRPDVPDPKSTIHNLALVVGFIYVP